MKHQVKCIDSLSILTEMKVYRHLYRCSYAEPFTARDVGYCLSSLACEARSVPSLSAEDVLPTFFTDEAIAYLMDMPNVYWLWKTVNQSTFYHRSRAQESDCIGLSSLQQAVDALRQLMASEYDLSKPIADLTQVEVARMAVVGLLLIRARPCPAGGKLIIEIDHNPLFAPAK